MTPESAHSPAGPGLLVRTPDAERSLSAGRSYVVGRDPQSDIFVNDSRVSWRHAVLRQVGATWMFEDVGSTNGSFQGRDRVQQVPISGSVALRLGHPDDGPAMSVSLGGAQAGHPATPPAGGPATRYADSPGSPPPPNPAVGRMQAGPGGMPGVAPGGGGGYGGAPAGYGAGPGAGGGYGPPGGVPGGGRHGPAVPAPRPSMERMPSQILQLPTRAFKIGRAADNDIVIEDLGVSRYHAELRKDARTGGYNIVDLGSHNGTFVNGQRVGSAPVTGSDIIAIGPSTFHMVGDELQQFIDTGDVSFIAQDLTVTLPSGRTLLDHVSFPLSERCLLGVIGPSGAGKSTLLGALTGNSPATQGTVFYDGRDLYRDYAELRHRIGLVPQENILHAQLTGRKALGYAAQLRFPRDTSDAERSHRIDEVLNELALTKHADTKVAAMSGGQQKRVNVALELLTKPSLLFLDEPTSGLDPGLDRKLMQQMQELAHNGHTVIVVTHSVASLNLCDRLLVLAAGGKIAFFGAPQDGLKHFGAQDWADVFQNFDDQPGRDWAGEYRNSVYYQQYIVPGMEGTGAVHARDPRSLPAAAPKSSNKISQTITLTRRYTSVIAADRGFLIALVGVPVLIAGIVKLLAPKYGLTNGPGGNTAATSLLLILALGSCLAGTVNSIRELVKERQIYSRERATGLSAGAYLMSKLIVLSVISAFQSIILVGLALIGDKLPSHGSYLSSPLVELIAAMALVSIASMALGLLISALVSTSEQSILLLFPIVIVQVIMTGGAVPVDTAGLKEVAWFFPARWGFGSAASTVDLGHITVPPGQPVPPIDPVWIHDGKTWLTDMGLSLALAVGFALVTLWRLSKQGPLKRGAGG